MDIIKVKAMSNGEAKGRAYTYKSNIEVNVGDLVLADFGGSEKVLQVTEVGILQSEAEGLDYEIKTIIGAVTDVPETQCNIEVVEETLPVIKINYEQMKTALTQTLTKYKNIVVTENTLSGCKAKQKELAGVRTKIDTYRKDKKKALSEPIVAFENQCKELIGLVEQVEVPIKEGIKLFDDKKRASKRVEAEAIIKAAIEESGLNEQYGKRLGVLEKYCGLSVKKSEVTEDVSNRAFSLKIEQDREQELLDIIQSTIDSENERITKKLSMADFDRLIRAGASTKDILAEVKLRANNIYEAENPAPVEEVEVIQEAPNLEIPTLPSIELPPEDEATEAFDVEECYMEIRCIATLEQLKAGLAAIRATGAICTVTSQGKI